MNLAQPDTKARGAGTLEWLAATKDMIIVASYNSFTHYDDLISERLKKAEADVVAGRVLGPFADSESALEAMQKRGSERSHY